MFEIIRGRHCLTMLGVVKSYNCYEKIVAIWGIIEPKSEGFGWETMPAKYKGNRGEQTSLK